MFKFSKILIPLLLIMLLISIIVYGTPTYVNLGPTSYIEGDVGIPGDCNYYKGGEIFEGGYTDLIEFVDQNNWKLFYSDGSGNVIELALGANGLYLKSNGETSAPTFDVPAGGGDVLGPATSVDHSIVRFNGTDNKTIQDSLAIVDDAGSVNIPTGQSYKINGIAVVAAEVDPTVDSDAELKAILADEVTKTGDFTAGRIPKINNATGIIEQSDIEKKSSGGYDVNANSIGFTEQVLASGTAISWDLRLGNKATLTAAHDFTITIIAPTEALNAQLIITQDGTGTRVMDEIVTQSDATIIEAEVHIDTEIIDLTIDIPTGARIRFKTSGVIPTPLVADTIYWAIRTSENHIQVATTKALAIAGTAVNLSDDGTDTQTVQQLVKWMGGTLGVLSTAVGSEDILSLTYKTADKQWYAVLNNDFY